MTTTTKATPERTVPRPPAGPPSVPPEPASTAVSAEAEDQAALWIRRGPHESPDDYDARWLRDVHVGDAPEFTWRGTLTGLLIGAVLSVSNLYLGLKAGWAVPVAITAVVLGGSLWRGLARVGLSKSSMGVLEQNCMQSTAAAATSSSAVLVTAVPAYMLSTGLAIQPIWLVLWSFFVSMLGLALVIPFERRLVRHESLAWPSAVATAQTLRTLQEKTRAAAAQAQWFVRGVLVAGLVRWTVGNTFTWWKLPAWPETVLGPGRFGTYGFGVDASLLYVAVGGLISPRVAAWMVFASTTVWGAFAPWLVATGRIESPAWGSVMFAGALWAGAGVMIGAGFTSLVLDAPVLWRGLKGLRTSGRGAGVLRDIELPGRWAGVGFALSSIGILWIGEGVLGIPWWASAIGLALSAFLASVAIRARGETDVTPAGVLGKVVQFGYGVAAPRALATNLFGATIVVGSAAVASEAATGLRCGHILGASPRKQFLAMASGVLVAVLAAVFAFDVLVPDITAIGTAQLPAPAAQAWRAVAELMAGGLAALDGVARVAFGVGTLLGIGLTLGDSLGARRPGWWPSAFGLGIGALIGVPMTVSMLVGSLIAQTLNRRSGDTDRTVALASGAIAGDSLVGVLLALLIAFGWMVA